MDPKIVGVTRNIHALQERELNLPTPHEAREDAKLRDMYDDMDLNEMEDHTMEDDLYDYEIAEDSGCKLFFLRMIHT